MRKLVKSEIREISGKHFIVSEFEDFEQNENVVWVSKAPYFNSDVLVADATKEIIQKISKNSKGGQA